ncbi:MAG TPA: hypothetical protein VGU19_09245 [Microvirga sp.]|nr:hypothetical protein [Microvirga sp.]
MIVPQLKNRADALYAPEGGVMNVLPLVFNSTAKLRQRPKDAAADLV